MIFMCRAASFTKRVCSRSKETSPSFGSPQPLVEFQQKYHSFESSYDYSFDGENSVTRGALFLGFQNPVFGIVPGEWRSLVLPQGVQARESANPTHLEGHYYFYNSTRQVWRADNR